MPFPPVNSHTTTVTVLAAGAASGYLPQCPLPQAVRHGQAVCRLSRQDLSRHVSRCHLTRTGTRTGKSDACLRPIAALTPRSQTLWLFPSHTPSQDQQTVAGKVLLMGVVEYVAALLLLPGSGHTSFTTGLKNPTTKLSR